MFFLLHTPLCSGGDTRATELSLLSSELLVEDEDEEDVDEEAKEPSISLSVKKNKKIVNQNSNHAVSLQLRATFCSSRKSSSFLTVLSYSTLVIML